MEEVTREGKKRVTKNDSKAAQSGQKSSMAEGYRSRLGRITWVSRQNSSTGDSGARTNVDGVQEGQERE